MSNYGLKTVALAKMAVASSIAAMALLGGGAVWMSTASSAEKPAPMPAWRKGLPAMKPFAIPGTSVDECKVFWVGQLNYSGAAAIDSDKQAMWFSVAAGGHAINNLNAVFKIDFMQDHPKWSQDCAPSSPEVQAAAGDAKYHSDGRPGSGHTYYSEWGFPTKDLAVRVRLTATHPGAINHWNSDAYSITKKDWVLPGGTAFPPGIPGFGAEVNMVGCEAQDPRNYDLYHHNGANVVRFSTEKWAWENFGSPAPGDQLWSYAPALIDTKLDRFVCIFGTRDANPATFAFQDLKSKAFGKITIVPDKQHGAPYLYEYNGACYDPDNNVYWYVGPDPAKIQSEAIVWTIDPTTGQATYMANVPGASSGPCNRFTYFRALKGIVYMPAGPELVFFPTK